MLNDDDTIGVCSNCFEFLAKHQVKTGKCWLSLVTHASCNPHHIVFGTTKNDEPIPTLEFLEQNGFILSTEIDTFRIAIKILGFKNEEDMFCVEKHSLD